MRKALALPLCALAMAGCDTMPADGYGPPYGDPGAAAYPQPYPPYPPYSAPLPPAPYAAPYGPDPSVYRAIGTEPFWDLTIGHDMVFTDRGNGVSVTEVTPAARTDGMGSTYPGRRLAVTITRGRCSDGMSDRSYPDTVTVTVDGRPYRGCGAATAFFQQLDREGSGLPPQGVFNLTNTNWRVVSVNGRPAAPGGYYLNFMPDRVSGRFGCNMIGAGYTVSGSTLNAGAVLSTRMLCENNNLEEPALRIMARPMTIAESGDRLTLSNASGTIELTRAR